MYKVKLEGYDTEIVIGDEPTCFNTTTVQQLKAKITSLNETKNVLNHSRLRFNDLILEDNVCLKVYGIKNGSVISVEKYYDPAKTFGIKFVISKCSISNENNGLLKAELSCGHAVDPNTLTGWCRSLINDGKLEFYCPAIVNEATNQKCEKKWGYDEIKKIALLNESEMEFFEKKLSENAASTFMDYKECPKCRSFVVRQDLTNLRVICTLCPVFSQRSFEFCWQCDEEWTVPITKSGDSCGRAKCVNPLLEMLRQCTYIKLSECDSSLQDIPSIRACPTCGNRIQHSGQACKNILCPRCSVEFCFACLETTAACQRAKPSSYFSACAKPVAPIQTKIPVWNRRN